MLDFTGQKVLITGATGGIGSAIVKAFSQMGAVVGLSATDKSKLEQLASTLEGETHLFSCDLSNREAVEKLFDEADEKMGGIDVMVCNAGITKDGLAMRMSDDDFDKVLEINLRSTFILNRAAIKKMIRKKYGRIVNISSIVAVMGNPGQANYVASKAGMIGMSKSIAMEVASRNITVNCVAPGFIVSPMTDVLTEEQKNKMLSAIPMGRMGETVDVANAVLFLASKEASYITGQTLHVNGGMLMV